MTEAVLLDRPATTADGERVLVLVNVDDPALLAALDPRHCDGVGLTRTEFLFQGADLPDEETQLRAYAAVLRWAAGRPVIIRTLDAGGDKPIPGLTPEDERNPFLGLRGLRLSLARQDVFRVQLRALARAAAQGPLKVMAPMVSAPDEFEAFVALFEEVVAELAAAGVAAARPALGMMVEVPAAALNVAAFRGGFPLDRQQRSDPVRDGGEPRRARGRQPLPGARSGRAGADPARGGGRRAGRARRSACAARWQRTRRSSLSCSPPACGGSRSRPPRSER